MGDFYQYYYALGESDDTAVERVRETVRLFMSCREIRNPDPVGLVVAAGAPVVDAELDALMDWGIAHMETSHDEQDHRDSPRASGIMPMLGFDWGHSGSHASLPRCLECEIDVDIDSDQCESWLDHGIEPFITCDGCGRTALAGDFSLRTTMVFRTNCGVVLENWPSIEHFGPDVHRQALGLIGHRPSYTIRKS
ncbi:hypothetical protein ACFVUS_06265 [Nocardia sp. NPDC058058]|uniref:hypothetical protein n=1 Tax=Nocardia sp. NPDC058058 TaxID=3346317 RepID=UPI0036D9F858